MSAPLQPAHARADLLDGLLAPLFGDVLSQGGSTSAWLGRAAVAAAILAATYALTRLVRPAQAALLRQHASGPRQLVGALPLLALLAWLIAFGVSATLLVPRGGPSDALFWALGGLALVIAFSDGLKQAVAGIFIILQGRLRPGEYVRIGDLRGRVERLGLQRIVLRAVDGMEHTLPPSHVLSAPLVREDAAGARPVRCEVRIPPGIEPQRAARLLYEVAALSPYADPRRRPEVAIDVDLEGTSLSLWGRACSPHYERRYRTQIGVRIHRELRSVVAVDDTAPPLD